MRAKSSSSIAFGMVNIPVGIYVARDSHDVQFHMFHRHDDGSSGRMRMSRVCEKCDKTLEYGDFIRGVERDDKVVFVTDDDVASIEQQAGKTLEVIQFVQDTDVDPITLEAPSYLAPPAKATKLDLQSYAVLRTVLSESQRVGIVRYADRSKTHIAVLRAYGDVLVLQNMAWPDEIREPDFAVLRKPVELDANTVKMANMLVENMLGDFNFSEYADTYTEKLTAFIDAKAAGADVATPDAPAAVEEVGDLLAKLEASIARHPAGKAKSRKSA